MGVLIYKVFLSVWKIYQYGKRYLLLFLILIVILFGLSKLRFSEKTSDKINFGIIQGNVDQNLKWNHTTESLILDKYFKLASETKVIIFFYLKLHFFIKK